MDSQLLPQGHPVVAATLIIPGTRASRSLFQKVSAVQFQGAEFDRCKKKSSITRTPQYFTMKHHDSSVQILSMYNACNRRYLAKEASAQSFDFDPELHGSKRISHRVQNALNALYRFCHPFASIGLILSVISVSLLAIEKQADFSTVFITEILKAVLALILLSIYISGLNQLYDIDIDKVNKPWLPLASGELSVRTGIIIVVSSAILSFWLQWTTGSWPTFWAIFGGFLLGTAYSVDLPFLRWKRSAVLAAMCILSNGILVQICYFLHMQTHVLKRPALFPRSLIFANVFSSFVYVVAALFKDIPDMDGDKIHGIQSLAIRLGKKRVFWICISLLQVAYGLSILVSGWVSHNPWSKIITVVGHGFLALILWRRAKDVDLESKAATQSFYMFIWKLVYAEYFLIPLIR